MKKILLLNLLLAMLLGATSVWAAVGDVFTANVTVIEDGETKQVPMRFQIQEPVQLYFGGYNNQTLPSCITYAQKDAISGVTTPAINKYQHGIVKIPTVVEGPDNLSYYVTGIGEDSFYGCNFSEIELPERYYKFEYASGWDTAYKIGSYAFHLSKITSIFIPDHYYIDGAIIRYCEQLTSVSIGEDDLYNSTLPDNFFMGCTSLKSVEFRGPVRIIRGNPFANCYALESISFPEGLETIESNAFHTCIGLKTVFLPSTLTQISSNAFSDCKKLENVILKCETPPTVNMLSGNNPFANISSSAVLYVPDRTKYLQEPWTSWFSEIKSILPTIEQTVNTWFYYSVGLTWDLFDYNHGYTESVTASDILDLMIDGVPTVPEVWEGYNELIVSKDPKHIPQEVSFLRKTSKGLVPYKLHYNVHNFGFSINGKEMTSLDMYNIPGLVSGDAYIAVPINDPDKPTLVLDNATLEWDGNNYGIYNNNNYYFTIKVIGDCSVTSKNYAALELDPVTRTTIEGGGTLNILSKYTCIESFVLTELTIQDNTKVIGRSTDGRGYYEGDVAKLEIKDGAVFAVNSKYEPLYLDKDKPVFGEGIDIRYPEGAYFSGTYNNLYYADGTKVENDWVVIGPDNQTTQDLIAEINNAKRELGFSINGEEMTTANMDDVPGVTSGSAHIETSETGEPILVLDNATLEWDTTGYGLHNHDTGSNGLTLRVLGDCTIKAPNAVAALEIDVANMITIEGGGTLNIISGSYPIETWVASTLRIQDATTVIAKSETGRSALWDQDGAYIEIMDGGVFAAFGKYEPIWLDSNGEFIFGEGIALRYPVGAYVGSGNNIYNADGTKVENDWVVIGPDNATTWELIDGVDEIVNSRQPADNGFIYNLAGQKISNSQFIIHNSKLPRGIYIQNGKKVIRK